MFECLPACLCALCRCFVIRMCLAKIGVKVVFSYTTDGSLLFDFCKLLFMSFICCFISVSCWVWVSGVGYWFSPLFLVVLYLTRHS